ncbi:MAG TPA: hypothetical protein VFW66_00370 [Gemmatimonadales bacterium]|nr:hypothetical protein [Gemmatimonadales bacterium]
MRIVELHSARGVWMALTVLAVLGAAPARAQSPPVVTVVARDFVFERPAPVTVPAGPITVRMINGGKDLHMIGIVWLGEHSVAEFLAAVQGDSLFPGPYEVGGPNAVVPGDTAVATVVLPPGHAVLACWVMDEDGKMHVQKGLFAPLEVAPAGPRTATEPHADARITLRDYAIDMAGVPAAGRRVFRVENRGPATHDVEVFRMAPGATMADVDAWMHHPMAGSRRARPLGGMVGVDRGHHAWFTVDLTAGDYVLVCWMPDAKGVPHYSGHRMLRRFRVAAG